LKAEKVLVWLAFDTWEPLAALAFPANTAKLKLAAA
jgi:hypothetical protein